MYTFCYVGYTSFDEEVFPVCAAANHRRTTSEHVSIVANVCVMFMERSGRRFLSRARVCRYVIITSFHGAEL